MNAVQASIKAMQGPGFLGYGKAEVDATVRANGFIDPAGVVATACMHRGPDATRATASGPGQAVPNRFVLRVIVLVQSAHLDTSSAGAGKACQVLTKKGNNIPDRVSGLDPFS